MSSFRALALLYTLSFITDSELIYTKPWLWTPIQKPFPRPVLYETELSNTFRVSVYLGSRNKGPPLSVIFTFSISFQKRPCGSVPCNAESSCTGPEFSYTLVLQGKESKYSRHVGPFRGKTCQSNFQIEVTDLRKDSEYTAYLVVFNGTISLKSYALYFSTSDVQWAHIIKGAHHLLVTCHFAPGTRAKGCRITMQVIKAHTSAKVDTKQFVIGRLYGVNEASSCIELDNSLSVGSVEVLDWEENGALGRVRVATAIEESIYSPCFIEIPVDWKYKPRILLFVLSAVFFLGGAVLVVMGIMCKFGMLHHHISRDYKSLQSDCRNP